MQTTLIVKTNHIGDIRVPIKFKQIGQFLHFEFSFLSFGTVEVVQKLCKDPIRGQLNLCSSVTNEQLDCELNACSSEPIYVQTHVQKMI